MEKSNEKRSPAALWKDKKNAGKKGRDAEKKTWRGPSASQRAIGSARKSASGYFPIQSGAQRRKDGRRQGFFSSLGPAPCCPRFLPYL